MYGQYVDFNGVRVWVWGVPSLTQNEWQGRAREKLQRLASQYEDT
jgi:hypothetical protein